MTYRLRSVLGLFVFGVILMVTELTNLPDSFFTQAEARVGRPLTPVSVAGVARRTTRRTVYATAVYVAPVVYATPTTTTVVVVDDNDYEDQQTAQAQQQAAQAQQQAAQAQQQAAQAEQDAARAQQEAAMAQQEAANAQRQSTLPVGATLPGLPAGCASVTVENQSYFRCGADWFRPAMQNGNIVYAVVADPR